MKIRKLEVDGFKGLGDRRFGFVDERSGKAARIVAVTGRAASGKTSVLDAILAAKESVGPYGALPASSELVRYDADAAKVTVEWEVSSTECDRFGISDGRITTESIFGETGIAPAAPDPGFAALLSEYDADASSGKVEYFHAHRGISLGGALDLSKSAGDTMDRMARLASDNTKYVGLVRFIVEAGLGLDIDAGGKAKPAGRIKDAFELLCSTKKLGGLYRAGGQVLPGFFDPTEKIPFGLTQLAASELDALLFATTFVRAGLVSNQVGSLILVDSPEKHVGEADAGRLVAGLAELGAENQLVVATRAPSVIAIAQHVLQLP